MMSQFLQKFTYYFIPRRHFSKKYQKNNSKKERFIVEPATEKDYDCIIKLMKRFYVPDEPILSSIGYNLNPTMERTLIESMDQGLTLIAKCKSNNYIVGGCINETTSSRDPDLLDMQACSVSCEKTRQILHFYAYIMRAPDLWNKYGKQEIFESSHLFVHKDKRGQGLATKLIRESRMLAKDCGFKIHRIDASNFKTSKVCKKLKMKLICQIPYNSFVNEEMKPIFNPKAPNKFISVYIDELRQKA